MQIELIENWCRWMLPFGIGFGRIGNFYFFQLGFLIWMLEFHWGDVEGFMARIDEVAEDLEGAQDDSS